MATRGFSEEDLSCPVCCEVFKDPVLLLCSHSICKMCLKKFWETRGSRECPICRKESSQESPPLNLLLRNLCETFLQGRSQRETFYSFVCQDSTLRKKHSVGAISEAVLELKEELKVKLRPLQQKLDTSETTCDETARHRRVQEQERQIKKEFEKLHQFLQDEEAARIAALREEEEQKSHMMEKIDGGTSSGVIGDQFKLAADSWTCGSCLLHNSAAVTKCVTCQTPKPDTFSSSSSSSSTKLDSNPTAVSIGTTSSTSSTSSGSKFGGTLSDASSTPSGSFKLGTLSNTPSGSFKLGTLSNTPSGSFKLGTLSDASSTPSGAIKLGTLSSTPSGSFKLGTLSNTPSGSFKLGTLSDASSTPSGAIKLGTLSSTPSGSFKLGTLSNTPSGSFKLGTLSNTPSFSFKLRTLSDASSAPCGGLTFGGASADSSRGLKFGGASDPLFSGSFNFGSLVIRDQKGKGSWECAVCCVQNNAKDLQCVACGKLKIRCSSSESTRGFKFGVASAPSSSRGFDFGSWECAVCSVQNKAKDLQCVACQSNKPAARPEPEGRTMSMFSDSSGGFKFGSSSTSMVSSGFKFGGTLSDSSSAPFGGFKFGGASSDSSRGVKLGATTGSSMFSKSSAGFKFGEPLSNPSSTPSSGFKFGGTLFDPSSAASGGYRFGGASDSTTGFKFEGDSKALADLGMGVMGHRPRRWHIRRK
ncbi:nuclear pore complex protein Nup153-like isoform X2 [Alosa sapidissima]|uniref:nuclear pore complex protein Nup153-like isoform X2 n=1 Tax=Alosa sapidissima TaxID=34773 RepID=UPI001C08E79B|nr:nuclear pore complex protein Nup153-like isoform X2 [Alosa sapidissima]